MKNDCDAIQPNLLDYATNSLTSVEAEAVRAHLAECPECTRLMSEELSFAGRLASVTMVSPENDVWALVRARTRPSHVRAIARIRAVFSPAYRLAAAAALLVVVATSAFLISNGGDERRVDNSRNQAGMVVQWADDPVGTHTNAVVSFIDNM